MQALEKYISELAMIPALSGHEQPVSDYLRNKFESFGLKTGVDVLGNTITSIKGNDEGPSVLVTAHMDQMGMMVRNITDKGFIKIERVGGLPEKTLSSLRVVIQAADGKYVPGVIGVKSHHLTLPEDKYKVDRYQDLYIDIGCDSAEEVRRLGIDVGSAITYQPSYQRLNGERISGTAFDNRLACAIIIELAKRFKERPAKAKVSLAGTVQEEYTIRGATLAARAVNPDICICLDVSMEGQTPDLKGANEVCLGKGPIISMYNFHGRGTLNGVMPHPALVRMYEETARKTRINLQKACMVGGLTELAYMQLEGKGIAGIDVDVPCRYTHSQIETADLGDVAKTADLTEAVIRGLSADTRLSR